MDEQYEDLEADGLEDDPVAKTYARDALEDVTSDDYSNPSERLGRLDTVGGLSSRILAGGETSDRWDEIYKRDAVAMPDRQEHGWEAAGSIAHNPFRSHSMDSFSKRVIDDGELVEPDSPVNRHLPAEGQGKPALKDASLYVGPYSLHDKRVVIPMACKGVKNVGGGNRHFRLEVGYLPSVCLSSGKTIAPTTMGKDVVGSPAIETKLVYFPRNAKYLLGSIYLIVLLASQALANKFLVGVETPVTRAGLNSSPSGFFAAAKDWTWHLVKYGPEMLVPTTILTGISVVLWVAAIWIVVTFFRERKTCHVRIAYPRHYRNLLFGFGLLVVFAGGAICYVTYDMAFLWVLELVLDPGVIVMVFGLWICWTAWHPLSCDAINDAYIVLETGPFMSSKGFPKSFLKHIDSAPKEIEQGVEAWRRYMKREIDEKPGILEGVVDFATPGSFVSPDDARKYQEDKSERHAELRQVMERAAEEERELAKLEQELEERELAKLEAELEESELAELEQYEDEDDGTDEKRDDVKPEESLRGEFDLVKDLASDSRSSSGNVLTEEVARKYLQDKDGTPLWNYKSLDEAAAQVLAKSEEFLHLSIVSLSPEAAAGLAGHQEFLSLNKVTELSVDAARELAKYQGSTIFLNGVTKLSANEAGALAEYEGSLYLNGLVDLSVEVADALGRQPGRLSLNGLTSLSVEAAKKLLQTEEAIELNGLTELPLDLAETLAQHKGGLDLDGLTFLTPDVAQALAKTKGTLELDGLTELTLEVAQALAQHQHHLTLDKVTEISLDVAQALSQHSGWLGIGLKEIHSKMADILSQYQGNHLSLYKLEKIEEDAARKLGESDVRVFTDDEKLPPSVVEILTA